MAKKPSRTPEQQEYRDNLAHDIKNLRQYGDVGNRLAYTLLAKEKENNKYIQSGTKSLKKREQMEKNLNETIREAIDKGDFDSVNEMMRSCLGTLDSKTADKLSEAGYVEMVRKEKRKFKSLGNVTYGKLKEVLKDDKKLLEVLQKNISLFEDNNYIVEDLISSGLISNFLYLDVINHCRGLDKETFKKLLLSTNNYLISRMKKNVFTGLDDESFKEMLNFVNGSNIIYLKDAMKCFSGLNKDTFLYIREMYSVTWSSHSNKSELRDAILDNIEIFNGLDEEIAEKLIEAGYGDVVAKHPEKFGLKEGK